MSAPSSTQVRSLYRRLLRELPSKAQPQTLLSHPSPLQQRIRTQFSTSSSSSQLASPEAVEQFIQYAQAQRMYVTLVERYNPGMNMSEEDRVRLTARRVGMDLPIEHSVPGQGEGEGR